MLSVLGFNLLVTGCATPSTRACAVA